MERRATTTVDATPERVWGLLADLEHYPAWLEVVESAEPAPGIDGEPGPAWVVTIAARVGPLRRSKRLRMVRVEADAPRRLVFERHELDDRDHAEWRLEATVAPDAHRSRVDVGMHYGGGLWEPLLEPVLGQMIDRAVPRLRAAVNP